MSDFHLHWERLCLLKHTSVLSDVVVVALSIGPLKALCDDALCFSLFSGYRLSSPTLPSSFSAFFEALIGIPPFTS